MRKEGKDWSSSWGLAKTVRLVFGRGVGASALLGGVSENVVSEQSERSLTQMV